MEGPSSTALLQGAIGQRGLGTSSRPFSSRRRELTLATIFGYSVFMLQSRIDVVVRKPLADDAEALAELFGKSWRLAYSGIIPHAHLEGIIRRRTAEWWRSIASRSEGMLVLEVSGEVAGYTTFGRARSKRWNGPAGTACPSATP